ncbi:transcriptional regulator additional sex combs [Bombus vancouverensis nearcticus]|uniref:Polycomb protein Asx isoform X2 n=1 Tax=Bombus bifarius TaxID=103933 RepID=A0A6P8MLN8_9HYME|nr:polycomb protein Asx isoform X2 [Bombus vancouverensis nearcticus]XP_033303485.1 polycomb protein Asx isoform X2 [Bombus bifarius]
MDTDVELAKGEGCETSPGCSGYSSMVHSKKVIKHALRQQAKRRRKNTTIAAGNSRTLPRIVVKPLPPPPPNDPPSPVNNVQHINTTTEEPAATMREVLASLPGFSLKSGRRRSTKRLSATAQLEAGLVDLESPASILASTSLRALLNRHTFQGLPPLYQRKLAQLLPAVDRQDAATSGLNNEFFARACLEWRKRLAEGEFTPENQQRLKMEAERDKNKLDPWKVKHFEPIWGEKREPKLRSGLHCITETRSGGAVTRSSLRLRLESNVDTPVSDTPCPIMSEDKVEEDNCKVETSINNSDELNETTEIQELLPAEYNETTHTLIDEKHIESVNINSVETIADTEMHQDKLEEDEKIIDLPEKQDIIEENEVVTQVCQESISNTTNYDEEIHLPQDEKNLQSMENHILEVSEENRILLPEENTSPRSSEQTEQIPHTTRETSSQLSTECTSQTSIDQVPQISKQEISQMSEEQIYPMSDCETTTILETSPSHEQVRPTEIVMDDSTLINNNQTEATQVSHENPTDGESQIPEGMEIDSETLQRIHELEVRGEMREVYEEISGCSEEIIYPILDGMEMGSNNAEETETQVVSGQSEVTREQQDVNSGNEDEALREANNYVCSEMLECSWSVDPTVNNINNNNRTQEELQVPWPLVAAALDGSVAANITVTTQDECNETPTSTDSANPPQQFINADSNVESVNCIQLPVVQGTPFQSEGLAIGTPGTSCIMKNFQSQSPPIITFPQLQSIRFVQTNFSDQNTTSTLNSTSPITAQIQNQQNTTSQVNIMRTQEEVVQLNTQNSTTRNIRNTVTQNQVPNTVTAAIGVQPQNRAQNTIVIQHQASAPTQPRQVVATIQQQQYPGTAVAVSSRSSRSNNQGSQRGSRNSNKEQGGGRSRSTTKEPPGAVNLERSYQICQAVIQSSPNRDQLKAHLKPPPSLLARGDGAFTTNKSGGRTITTVKTQKPSQTIQNKQAQNKTQAVMLRHVFATARQATSTEVPESNTVAQLGSTTTGGLGQYILVQRTGVGDSAPRASSAPPLPPQIAGMGVGVHLVRGRPASAGEGSHQAVTLKARGTDGRGGGGAEPGAPGMIMGGDPPPPCECNMRGAMVICRQCGAFCHDDCIGPQRICATCLIR